MKDLKKNQTKVIEIQSKIKILSEELSLYVTKPNNKIYIHSPEDLYELLEPMVSKTQEEFWVVCLNTRKRVIDVRKLYAGNQSSSVVRLGEVLKVPIIHDADSFIVAHNHPSGDPSPSSEDVNLTRAITQAGKLMDIELLDHMIIGDDQHGKFISLKRKELGF